MKTLQTILFMAFFCTMMIVLGGTVFCTMVEYPNWFASIPSSLEATRNFYKVLHPGYFFQIWGPAILLTGISFIIAGWRIKQARNMVAVTVGLLIAIELLTFIYIYPRLGILFGADAATQPLEALQTAAAQFTTADQIRTGLSVLAGGFSIAALFRFFKHRYALS
jgi:hypothetical protein